jgi:transcriptional regulator with XRE-family HTH domain
MVKIQSGPICAVEAPNQDLSLGAELRLLRTAMGLGLNEAAGRSKISNAALSQWERGMRTPSGAALDRLLEVLKVDARTRARILTGADPFYARIALAAEPLGPVVDIAQLLRGMRLRSRMTQAELANLCSIRQSSVAGWEAGDALPSQESLQRALVALDASSEEMEAIGKCRLTTSDAHAQGDMAERLHTFHSPETPLTLREPMILLLQRDAWRGAVQNPAYDEILCETITWRGAWNRAVNRPGESVQHLRHALRLAKSTQNYDMAVLAAIYLSNTQAVGNSPELNLRIYHSLMKFRDKPLSHYRRAQLLLRCGWLAMEARFLERSWVQVSEDLAKEAITLFGPRPKTNTFPYFAIDDAISLLSYCQIMHNRSDNAIEVLKTVPEFESRGFLDPVSPSIADAYLLALWDLGEEYPEETQSLARHWIATLPPDEGSNWREWDKEIMRKRAGLPSFF